MLPRLVVVSNRVSLPRKGVVAGGLAVALFEALEKQGGLWFGWSGEVAAEAAGPPRQVRRGPVTIVTTDFSRADYQDFYSGYSNSSLWPLFHYRLGLMEVSRRSLEGYLRVNAAFAAALAPMLRPDDLVWVHDYHLIPLGEELRRLGIANPIGFFLHTPFPVPDMLVALPGHRRLVRAMASYDLVGFQTPDDVRAFLGYVAGEARGEVAPDGSFTAFGRTSRARAYPIGIDAAGFAALAVSHADTAETRRLKASMRGRRLILGVDRLDYSKGLPQRFDAVECLIETRPEVKGTFEFMQIAAPSREDVARYRALKRQLESAAGRINGRFAEFDWQPVRYLNKSYDRATLAGFYRAACVGLVTPLRDGMNLVAKEYVAAQNPEDPGVLVLSRFAGAARELEVGALVVNPYDLDEVADALARALSMPREQRVQRWRAMMEMVEANTVARWRDRFLADLGRLPAGLELDYGQRMAVRPAARSSAASTSASVSSSDRTMPPAAPGP
ncbi:alpha,alpha-trehalose-phosphate synthase (UDP-forming) [Magnetospirillum sp. UT-4]|uniref:alpha,alpha-trehalose-phosphate synthase (UDP-forming) n=1 Tax=Magnetospirillum sp. UT-4 TaxID=2681467 RepID=UPI00137D7262|nr:alpha,alpha-trehalose-phosphate synthase (UDP-forming) [Magnetospirillum sp. UT-4]CAA7623276.1 putative alpha,alpha-trehalose-phosphate synthase (UDP-forming) [Magnetospirillum sp. UT-4]